MDEQISTVFTEMAALPPQETKQIHLVQPRHSVITPLHHVAVSLAAVAENPYVDAYIRKADEDLAVIGYTEHGLRHANIVGHEAMKILKQLNYSDRMQEMAAIAGYLHDIGNVVNRNLHAQTGAALVHPILMSLNTDPREAATILGAIGNHDEKDGHVVSEVSAAVILADKTDVSRSRVHNVDTIGCDIHDRVNYATLNSSIQVNLEEKRITFDVEFDHGMSSVMEFFAIFLTRMEMSRKAAEFLGCEFKVVMNHVPVM